MKVIIKTFFSSILDILHSSLIMMLFSLENSNTEAKAETTKDHSEGKPSSETLNKAKTKIKDALS